MHMCICVFVFSYPADVDFYDCVDGPVPKEVVEEAEESAWRKIKKALERFFEVVRYPVDMSLPAL